MSPEIIQRMSGMDSPEPYLAELPLPPPSPLTNPQYQKVLALDGVNDPGNLGTLIRTGLALDFDAVYLTDTCVDLFNDKAIRAAKGSTFILPYNTGSPLDLWKLIDHQNFHAYTGDMDGTSLKEMTFQTPLVLIMGNEALGPSILSKQRAHAVTIPLSSQVNSLNVAVAGGILMNSVQNQIGS